MVDQHIALLTFEHRVPTGEYSMAITKNSIEANLLQILVRRQWMENGNTLVFSSGCQLAMLGAESIDAVAQRICDEISRLAPPLKAYAAENPFADALRFWLSFNVRVGQGGVAHTFAPPIEAAPIEIWCPRCSKSLAQPTRISHEQWRSACGCGWSHETDPVDPARSVSGLLAAIH